MNINMSKEDQALVKAVNKACNKLTAPRKVYEVSVFLDQGGTRRLSVRNSLPLSREWEKIKAKVGDLNQYELNKWFKVKI